MTAKSDAVKILLAIMLVTCAVMLADDIPDKGIFPDPVYCALGAGVEVNALSPNDVQRWRALSEAEKKAEAGGLPRLCVHNTIWSELRHNLKRSQ